MELHNFAFQLTRAGQPLRAVSGFDELLARHRSAGQPASPVVINAYVAALNQLGRFEAALPLVDQAIETARQQGNTRAVARGRMLRAIAACSAPVGVACGAAADEAEFALREFANLYLGSPHTLRAMHALAQGRTSDAAVHAAAARADTPPAHDPEPSAVHAWAVDARVALRLGQLGEARQAADRAVGVARTLARGLPHADHLGHALAVQSEVLAAQGDKAAARAALQEALVNFEPALGGDAAATREARQRRRVLE